MKKSNYLFYSEYIKGKKIIEKDILVSKTKKSYLIGPLINQKFDSYSFYRRLMSNSIYSPKIYKRMSYFRCKKIINQYKSDLNDNEIIEVFKNKNIIKHKIIKLPGENYD